MSEIKNYPGQIAPNGTELSEDPLKDMVRLEPPQEFSWLDEYKSNRTGVLGQPYWIGKYQVTRRLHALAMHGTLTELKKLTQFGNGDFVWKYSRELREKHFSHYSWDEHCDMPHVFSASMEGRGEEEVFEFLERLNEIYRSKLPSGYCFGLPTEVQWEYACRAGVSEPDASPEAIGRMAWQSRPGCSPVGRLQPNGFGLYDMLGNAWEICSDLYGKEPQAGQELLRVAKGGCCLLDAKYGLHWPAEFYSKLMDYGTIGMRLALIPVEQAEKVAKKRRELSQRHQETTVSREREIAEILCGYSPEEIKKLTYSFSDDEDHQAYIAYLKEKAAEHLPFKLFQQCLNGGLDLVSMSEFCFSYDMAKKAEKEILGKRERKSKKSSSKRHD